ncbi:MAG: SAM-dependent chlorinase/fluorinase [Infirmifilum sp.]
MSIVAFMSDFGLEDYYVGAVKAVIKRICSRVEVIDITHLVKPWSLIEAEYLLSCCYDDFPEGTVFLVVVDPGVGTNRRAIVVQSDKYWFVGPDNGVFTTIIENTALKVWNIIKTPYSFKSSYTFHGRDVFAPIAAYIACGGAIEEIGENTDNYVRLSKPPTVVEGGFLKGYVTHVDRFGNVATNISAEMLEKAGIAIGSRLRVHAKGKHYDISIYKTFGEAQEGELFALTNSCGKLEFAVNKGSASDRTSLRVGDVFEARVI